MYICLYRHNDNLTFWTLVISQVLPLIFFILKHKIEFTSMQEGNYIVILQEPYTSSKSFCPAFHGRGRH